jgi:hypothetical protein
MPPPSAPVKREEGEGGVSMETAATVGSAEAGGSEEGRLTMETAATVGNAEAGESEESWLTAGLLGASVGEEKGEGVGDAPPD